MPTGGGFKPAANQDVSTKPINVAPHSPTPLDAVGLVARRVLVIINRFGGTPFAALRCVINQLINL